MLFKLIFVITISLGWSTDAVPRGSPWPMPSNITTTTKTFSVRRNSFQFSVTGQTCDILDEALVRYFRIIFDSDENYYEKPVVEGNSNDDVLRFEVGKKRLTGLKVEVRDPCGTYLNPLYPQLNMDESYSLTVKSCCDGLLSSKTVWGALRGLETFSQLIYYNNFGLHQINETEITDEPRFSWRGVLLDTSRHFLSKKTLLQNLDAMAANKFNVFHWHIVDDQAFPYKSRTFPQLSLMGAYDPYRLIYTQQDIKEIIEYARLRGIRVVPEFDTPGHTHSWGKGVEFLLTKCFKHGQLDGTYGPIYPITADVWFFLWTLFREIKQVFKDRYMHLGGDEVDFGCWKSNPNITTFMEQLQFGTDFRKLENFYFQQLFGYFKNDSFVVWQEVFDNSVKLPPDTVVQVWKKGTEEELGSVTAVGFQTILSSPWYLSHISPEVDWHPFYQADPHNFNGTDAQKALVIGGEACMWGEHVDSTNVMSTLWPRASPVAERLWSPKKITNIQNAASRLEEHRCRLLKRGVNAKPPNGPGFCP